MLENFEGISAKLDRAQIELKVVQSILQETKKRAEEALTSVKDLKRANNEQLQTEAWNNIDEAINQTIA